MKDSSHFNEKLYRDVIKNQLTEIQEKKIERKQVYEVNDDMKCLNITRSSIFPLSIIETRENDENESKKLKSCEDGNGIEKLLLKHFSTYSDVYFSCASKEVDEDVLKATAKHVFNHTINSNDLLSKNNKLLGNEKTGSCEADEYRDQGFCRLKTLVLFPMKNSATKFITEILNLCSPTELVKITIHYNFTYFFR